MKNVPSCLRIHVTRWCIHPESPEGSTSRVHNTIDYLSSSLC